jgi:phage terminase Nu1 subunit (DNA packaging protein)
MTRQPARSANRPTRPEMAKAAEERARWAREQADFVALKNRRLRGELLGVGCASVLECDINEIALAPVCDPKPDDHARARRS